MNRIFFVGFKEDFNDLSGFYCIVPGEDYADWIKLTSIGTIQEQKCGKDEIVVEDYNPNDSDYSWIRGFPNIKAAWKWRNEVIRILKEEVNISVLKVEIIIMKAIIPEKASFLEHEGELWTNHIISYTNEYWLDYDS